MPDRALQLRVSNSFDRLAWRQSLRDSDVLHALSGAEWAVFWFAYDRSDGLGQVDLPKDYIAEDRGLSIASVKRALRCLIQRGLLSKIKARGRANRYQLTAPAACVTTHEEAGPMRIDRTDALPTGGSNLTLQGGQICAMKGVKSEPQSRDKSREKSSRERSHGQGGLFAEPAAYDPAAAAILISAGLRNPNTSKALVACHRITREQARNIRSNLRSAKRAGVTISNPAGWVRAAVQRGEVVLDDRVIAQVEQVRVRSDRRAGQREQDKRDLQAEQAKASKRAAFAQAEKDFDALPDDRQRQLMDAQQLTPNGSALSFKNTDRRLRKFAIEVLAMQILAVEVMP